MLPLDLQKNQTIIIALIVVVLLKLIFKPFLAYSFASIFQFPKLWTEVLVILAAMPSAVLGVVFLRRYGGDAPLASTILLIVTIISSATLLGVFWLAF